MRQILAVAGFEFRHHLRQLGTWVYFAIFGALAFTLMAAMGGAWSDFDLGAPVLVANSPSGIAGIVAMLSLLAVPVSAGIAGRAAYRDFSVGIHPLFFTTPVSRTAYLGGRYLGAVGATLLVLASIPLGAGAYLFPLFVFVLPNVLLTAALFVVLAALTRRFVAVQVGGLALLLGWSISQVFVSAIDFAWLTHLSDPFGLSAMNWSMRYWTVAEQNSLPVPLSRPLVLNRLLWLAVGAAVLAYGIARFRFAQFAREEKGRPAPAGEQAPSLAARLRLPDPARSYGFAARLAQVAAVARAALWRIVRGVWFWILAGMCVVITLVGGIDLGSIYGTRTYPVTYQVLELVVASTTVFLVVILAVYAGELVWEEREARAAQLFDSLPVPSWVPIAGKLLALAGINAVLLLVGLLTGVMIQTARGYFRYELLHYLAELFVVQYPGLLLYTVLAVAIQSLSNHKYVGHLIVILYFVLSPFLWQAGLSHNALLYGSTPTVTYSDMNGYGHTLAPFGWYTLYWTGWALLLAVAGNLFWVRGEETGARWRIRLARMRAGRPVVAASVAALALILGTGGFIAYNTTVLNDWMPEEDSERIQAEYEIRYKRYEDLPQPRITDVRLEVDLDPAGRDVALRGVYRLINRSNVPVSQVHVDLVNTETIERLELGVPATRFLADTVRGYHAFRLARPLAPGDSTELRFTLRYDARGFEDEPSFLPVVQNGTFFANQWLPGIGYNPDGELTDEGARRKYGLSERPRIAAIDDPRGRMRNELGRDADWIRFAATVSTSAGQVAIAPGNLVREWRQGNRHYFRYEMDVPMLNFYSFLSARYAVRRDRWGDVQIEVYYDPAHPYNVGRMINAVKKSLDYYTREFGPYQHRQIRIVEFPRYAEYAQSFAGTIPYSEGIGFIADVRRDDIDYPFFVTAHEVGHQWWGHQAVPANVQGSSMLSETLAEYSALMVMEKEFGRAHIGRFLRYELDGYLKGRGEERRAEMPVALVEHQQYIHYNKGALAMYALRDYVGEEAINGAIRAYLRGARFRGAPYPTSRDLVQRLYAATPDSLDYLVEDLFETVTLWDLRAEPATVTRTQGGGYLVDFTVSASKTRADGLGRTTPEPIGDWIDVGVLGEDGETPLFLRRYHFTGAPRRFRITVSEPPSVAGIDPLHKLIDREREDNTVKVDAGAARLPSPVRPNGGGSGDTTRRTDSAAARANRERARATRDE